MTRREQGLLIFVAASIVAGSCFLWWEQHRRTGITIIHDEETVVVPPVRDAATVSEDDGIAESPMTSPAARSTTTVATRSEADTEARTPRLSVSVAGAVKRPGVYRLPVGSIVEEAVDAAGGYAESADPTGINRAAKLIDGTTLTVPAKRSIYAAGDSGPVLKIPSPVTNIPAYLPGSIPEPTGQQISVSAPQVVPSPKVNINTASREELEALPHIGPKLAAAIIEYRTKHPFRDIEELQNVSGIGPKTLAGVKELITVSGG